MGESARDLFRIIIIFASLFCFNCSTNPPVKQKTTEIENVKVYGSFTDEIVISPTLKTLFSNPKPLSIVLRVPTSLKQQEITQEENASYSYQYLEKELLKIGFLVKDRTILEKIISKNENIDYSSLRKEMDTDLILEITEFSVNIPTTFSVYEINGEKLIWNKSNLNDTVNPFRNQSARLSARIINVNGGEICGIFLINYNPIEELGYLDYIRTKERKPERDYLIPNNKGPWVVQTSYSAKNPIITNETMYKKIIGKFMTILLKHYTKLPSSD